MRKNANGSEFWTGLPAGELYEKICAEGLEFVVYTADYGSNPSPLNGEVRCIACPTEKEWEDFCTNIWNAGLAHDYMFMRAENQEAAIARFYDAQDQHTYWFNGGDKRPEAETLNIVLLPEKDRPEGP